jgi:hypothetical protein
MFLIEIAGVKVRPSMASIWFYSIRFYILATIQERKIGIWWLRSVHLVSRPRSWFVNPLMVFNPTNLGQLVKIGLPVSL